MRVGFLQLDSKLLDIDANVDNALRKIERTKADLLVLPELFNTGYNFRSKHEAKRVAEKAPGGYTSEKLLEASADSGGMIVAGIAERSDGSLYNSAIVVRNGRFLGTYRKVHLFRNEKKFFKPGREFKVFPGRVGVMVCFDWYFPEAARTLMLKGARIIAHPSNLVLPHCPDAMVTRCLENRIFAVTANRVGAERGLRYIGLSEIVDPRGRILHRASAAREETRVRAINPRLADNKRITEMNYLLTDRRPRSYAH